MHSFTTFTAATAFAALTAAVPHARSHYHLLPVRHAEIEALALKGAPIAGREVPTFGLDLVGGTCGGDTGNSCQPGLCCSQYGYCGSSPEYCGAAGSSDQPSAKDHGWGPNGYQPPKNLPPSYSSPSQPSGAPAPSVPAAAPSSPASAPSSPAQPSYAPAPSAPAPVPSAPAASAPAPSYPAPAPSSPPSGSSQAPPAPAPSSPAPSSPPSSPPLSSGGNWQYKQFSGDGSTSAGWPSEDQWMDFESAFAASEPNMLASCAQWGQENDSQQEVSDIKSAIQSVASSSGVDARFILAVMMQESNGCVRVQTTDNGVTNPGLMQSHNGPGSCNGPSGVLDPCPADEIKQMLSDGVEGTPDGDGLQQTIASAGSSGSQGYFRGAVIYNSGNLPANLDDNTATPCYASDVANRLMGWVSGPSSCTL